MLEFNKWFFVQLINFLALIVVLNYALFKPLLRLFKERDERVKNALDSAKAMAMEREDLLQRISARLIEANTQAKATFENLKKEGISVQKDLIDGAKEDATNMLSKAQEELNAELKKAKDALYKEVKEFSTNIVKKLIGV